jgi:hypothetical protein
MVPQEETPLGECDGEPTSHRVARPGQAEKPEKTVSLSRRGFLKDAGGVSLASLMGAATCALLYLIVKELYDRRTGILAGLLCAFLPPFIAHGKTLGLEAPMTLFYVAALYGIVRWFKDDTRLEPLLWAGLCTSLAIFSRMTAVWLIPTLLVPYLHAVIAGPDSMPRAYAGTPLEELLPVQLGPPPAEAAAGPDQGYRIALTPEGRAPGRRPWAAAVVDATEASVPAPQPVVWVVSVTGAL